MLAMMVSEMGILPPMPMQQGWGGGGGGGGVAAAVAAGSDAVTHHLPQIRRSRSGGADGSARPKQVQPGRGTVMRWRPGGPQSRRRLGGGRRRRRLGAGSAAEWR